MDLRRLIDASPLSQAGLARVLGVSRATVNSWLTRERIPAEHIAGVVTALGLSRETAAELYRANGLELPPVLVGRVEDAVQVGA